MDVIIVMWWEGCLCNASWVPLKVSPSNNMSVTPSPLNSFDKLRMSGEGEARSQDRFSPFLGNQAPFVAGCALCYHGRGL